MQKMLSAVELRHRTRGDMPMKHWPRTVILFSIVVVYFSMLLLPGDTWAAEQSPDTWPHHQPTSSLLSSSSKKPANTPLSKILLDREHLLKLIGPGLGRSKTIGDPGYAPIPAGPDCACEVFQWITDARGPAVYFTDESFEVNYSVDCATSVTIGDTQFISTARKLEAAEGGYFLAGGGGGVHYSDAAAEGKLSGSYTVAAGSISPGLYLRPIFARNADNPDSDSCDETLSYHIIERPPLDASCTEADTCIYNMLREIRSLVSKYITNNEHLDSEVAALADGIYQRKVIGLKLERELEVMTTRGTTFICQECPEDGGIHWDEATPDLVYVAYCMDNSDPRENWTFTDYSVLHELTHKVGFNTDLIDAYVSAGLWDGADVDLNRQRVEEMTATVSGAPWEERGVRAHGCWVYDTDW